MPGGLSKAMCFRKTALPQIKEVITRVAAMSLNNENHPQKIKMGSKCAPRNPYRNTHLPLFKADYFEKIKVVPF
jgi:hypothetical protein